MIRTPMLVVTIQQIIQNTGEIVRCWPACFVERRNLFRLQTKSNTHQPAAQRSRWKHLRRFSVEVARSTSATDSLLSVVVADAHVNPSGK